MCVTRTSLGLMVAVGVRSTSSKRLIFGGLVIAIESTVMSLSTPEEG